MSDFALPELKLVDPPGHERWLIWTALASLLIHATFLAVILWSPLKAALEATQPRAIDVELVPPPEPEVTEKETGDKPADASTPEQQPAAAAAAAPAAVEAAEPARPAPAPAQPAPDETPSETPTAPAAATAETAAGAAPSTTALAETPPTPLPRPAVRTEGTGTQATAGPSSEPVAALEAESGDAEGAVPDALSADPGLAALELGELREAGQFYLEAMLQQPGLARAAEMLKTLPAGKRLSQTCNIEALAQIGFSGEGFAPDVVMTDAYALSTTSGTTLSASGAIFRSQDKWYGLAFDCTLSEDLTQVTDFSYRLGADVTEAVLARMGQRSDQAP